MIVDSEATDCLYRTCPVGRVKIPTLSLQRTQGQGWGTRIVIPVIDADEELQYALRLSRAVVGSANPVHERSAMVNEAAIGLDATSNRPVGFSELFAKTAVAHTITYMFMGILAATGLHYGEGFAKPEVACYMRQLNHPQVMAGPLFQPIRGLVFALAFYPLREVLFGRKRGWLVMWWLLVALGILGTFGPAPASLEGMVYTTWPVWGAVKRMAGSGAAGAAAVGVFVLLGESSEKVAELDAGGGVRDRDGVAGVGTADAAASLIRRQAMTGMRESRAFNLRVRKALPRRARRRHGLTPQRLKPPSTSRRFGTSKLVPFPFLVSRRLLVGFPVCARCAHFP